VILLYGDTNSTLAGAIVGAKVDATLAHVEAGLRSFTDMPEEVNRVLADHAADLLFAPTTEAVANLAAEGITDGVHETGDVMYDALQWATEHAADRSGILEDFGVTPGDYVLATVHRERNTDDQERLRSILEGLQRVPRPVVFPAHPRTVDRLERYGLLERAESELRVVDPVGYPDFVRLLEAAERIATDSGGVQKEAFFLDTPCVTLREETEWVETVACGWNELVGADRRAIERALREERSLEDKPSPTEMERPPNRSWRCSTVLGEYEFAVCLTHDVDRPYKTYQGPYYAVTDRDLSQLRSLFSSNRPYWQFEEIMALEEDLGVRSTFFFLNERNLFREKAAPGVGPSDELEAVRRTVRPHRRRDHRCDSQTRRRRLGDRLTRLLRVVRRPGSVTDGEGNAGAGSREADYRRATALPSPGSPTDVGDTSGYRDAIRREPGINGSVRVPARVRPSSPVRRRVRGLPADGDGGGADGARHGSQDRRRTRADPPAGGATKRRRRDAAVASPFFNEDEFDGYRRLYVDLVEYAQDLGAWVGPCETLLRRTDRHVRSPERGR